MREGNRQLNIFASPNNNNLTYSHDGSKNVDNIFLMVRGASGRIYPSHIIG
jgi:hypothetical protein